MSTRGEKRIAELRELGCGITDAAAVKALGIAGQLPHLTIGIFPTGEEDNCDGGISLQAVTETSTIIVRISAEGVPVVGECADYFTYYEQELFDRSDAIRWFKTFAPEAA
jgi:hypothetical protein